MKEFCVAAFRSRQHVLSFNRALEAAHIDTSVINTPHEIAIGCGLSVKFDIGDYARVKKVFSKQDAGSFVGFYKVKPEGTRFVCIPLYKQFS